MTNFAELVENVKSLSTHEKEELHELIEKYLIEERRDEIHDNAVAALSDSENLVFTSDTRKMKELLLND